jgi:serine/threonine protein kinase
MTLPLALKVIICKENSRPPGPDSKVRKKALAEVKNMASIRHPHIVAYVASFEDYCIETRGVKPRRGLRAKARPFSLFTVNQQIKRHILGIAMYPPGQCNLHTFMAEVFHSPKESKEWMLAHLHTYFGCLSQAVAYLHDQGVRIRHKDIKPENVIIDDFGLPILTDFGLSKHFEIGQLSEGPTPKTLKYADPEAMHETSRDVSSDIFSLGCVFLEMATVLLGKPPAFAEEQLRKRRNNNSANVDGEERLPLVGGGEGQTDGNYDGDEEFKYSECIPRLNAYIMLLRSCVISHGGQRRGSVEAVIQVLPHIRRMMNEDPTNRPRAQDLYPLFRHLYDVYDYPGPCPNCEAERATGQAIPSPKKGAVLGANGMAGPGTGSQGSNGGSPSFDRGRRSMSRVNSLASIKSLKIGALVRQGSDPSAIRYRR